jgi:Glycosyl transferase family 2
MKLVMTLRTRDEADVVDAQIAFHLNASVDFVVATDHSSGDGTVDILERYARQGYLHLIREHGELMDEGAWATRMSRLAATEFGADWIIPSDADEFWWPRGGSLKEVLASVPGRYGIVRALLRQFVPRPDDGAFFAERMTARVATVAPINDPTSLFRPNLKSIHRADPKVTLSAGAHTLHETQFVPLRGWYPIEFVHFPIRSFEQCERKYRNLQSSLGPKRNAYYDDVYRALENGTFAQFYETLVLDDSALERGLADGSLVIDTRLRDVLRSIRSARNGGFSLDGVAFPRPTVVDEAAYAVDVAAVGEADVVRVQRRLDELEQRVAAVESGLLARIARRFAR